MSSTASMEVELEIHRRIQERGRLTFAEFMELALFWPEGGYYSVPSNIGPSGDYYTAPGAHPAFSALLCVQAYQLWRLLDCPATFWLVDMGAGGGLLCRDLVEYSAHMPQGFCDSLRFLCLDRPASPGVEAQLTVGDRRRVDRLAAEVIPLRGIEGCLLSNELVDSFPVHRVTMRDGVLKEVYVTAVDGELIDVLDNPSSSALEARLETLGVSLPEGFGAEINLAMEPWLEEVSSALERGFVITIDYGHVASELYSHRRRRGTLTCYYGHTQTDDPYLRIGRQDITAQVDFTSLVSVGQSSGLEPLGLNTQREFLHNLGLRRLMGRLTAIGTRQRDLEANRLGMLDIARKEGLGGFKVLVQGKGVGTPPLWGFGSSVGLDGLLEELPIPTLSPYHMPLLRGRYPHTTFDWQEMWPGNGDSSRLSDEA